MELENKYYIPSIEEFHVGFEYEYKNHTGTNKELSKLDWKKSIVNSINDIPYIERGLYIKDNTRVKYLDKEDIESLGWKVVENVGNTEFEMGLNYIMWFNKTDKNDLTILRRTKLIQPRNPPIIHNQWEGLFCGIIKNKSELKKLMQQLQINEN